MAVPVAPEFLWEKHSDCAAFRRPDNRKWFAIILRSQTAPIADKLNVEARP